jgi:hypothetical protein
VQLIGAEEVNSENFTPLLSIRYERTGSFEFAAGLKPAVHNIVWAEGQLLECPPTAAA